MRISPHVSVVARASTPGGLDAWEAEGVKLNEWVKSVSVREALVQHERAGGVAAGRCWRWQGVREKSLGDLSHVTLTTVVVVCVCTCVCMCAAMSPVAMMQRSLPSIFSSSASSLPQGVMVMQVEQQPQPRRPTQAPRFSATESAGPQLLGRRDDEPRLERPFFAMGACATCPLHSPSSLTPCEPNASTNTRKTSGRDQMRAACSAAGFPLCEDGIAPARGLTGQPGA